MLPFFYNNGNGMGNKKGSENIDAIMSMCHKYYYNHTNAINDDKVFNKPPFDN